MKKDHLSIILFGMLLATLAVMLEFLEYRYFIGSLETSVYTSVVATVFTGVGIWIGYNFLKRGRAGKLADTGKQIDASRLKKLKLNEREYQVLELISRGCSNQEIANRLFLALPTIKTHTSNLYSKLGVQRRTHAIHRARTLKLI